MRADRVPRVMWLLNHSTARKFEVPMLKRIGVAEVFLPKKFPQEVGFRSASADLSEDKNLTIPAADLATLNEVEWNGEALIPKDTIAIANKWFDVAFFIWHGGGAIASLARHFEGPLIWRAYGLDQSLSYTRLMVLDDERVGLSLMRAKSRLHLGTAYRGISEVEDPFLRDREIYLPLGMPDATLTGGWVGGNPRVMFVCPDIQVSPYYGGIYERFKRDFGHLPHTIGGMQAQKVPGDQNVLGFVTAEQHHENMRQHRVMFYHSTEPRHIHYHPLEAIRVGMPLVFMAGGLLDQLGGKGLPGRAKNTKEAKKLLQRVLDGDAELTRAITDSQPTILDAFDADRLEPFWREGMGRLLPKATAPTQILSAHEWGAPPEFMGTWR